MIRRAPERFRVVALAAGRSADKLAAQARELRPAVVGLVDGRSAAGLAAELPPAAAWPSAPRRWPKLAAAEDADVVLNGVTGSVGLAPTPAGRWSQAPPRPGQQGEPDRRRGAGHRHGKPGQIVPIDSEHSGSPSACGPAARRRWPRLVVTASGGPFRGTLGGRPGRRHPRPRPWPTRPGRWAR